MKKSPLYTGFENFLYSPAYFLLFSAYPVMALFAQNVFQVDDLAFLPSLTLMLALSAALYGLFWLVFRSAHKPAVLALVFVIFFSAYGHMVNVLFPAAEHGSPDWFVAAWLVAWVAALVLTGWLLSRHKIKFKSIAPALNLMAIVLLLFPLAKIVRYKTAESILFEFKTDHYQPVQAAARPAPDIYYIILDGYTRSDVFLEYGYDNHDFIAALEGMGFYVAQCGQSNYSATVESLSATLNMDYIPQLGEQFVPENPELLFIFKSLQANSVRRMLQDAGYQTVAFESGFPWAEMRDADWYYQPAEKFLNELDVMFLNTTSTRILDEMGFVNLDEISGSRFRDRTTLVLDTLDEVAALPGPKFVFVHLMTSHAPFVFDAQGNPVAPDQAGEYAYANASKFISDQIAEKIKVILAESETPPVIILQGDHGPWTNNEQWRLSILNAYYLPGYEGELYPTITPVNTFRLVFNTYFNTDYPLLEDQSYISSPPYIYNFKPVENNCISP